MPDQVDNMLNFCDYMLKCAHVLESCQISTESVLCFSLARRISEAGFVSTLYQENVEIKIRKDYLTCANATQVYGRLLPPSV